MALPAILLKAKSAVKKGNQLRKGIKATKQNENTETNVISFNMGTLVKIVVAFMLIMFSAIAIVFLNFAQQLGLIQASDTAYASTGGSANINDYTNWAVDIANDDSHGYSQCNRTGPDYDCSSLVWYSLVNGAGYSESDLGGYPFSTYGEAAVLKKIGFTEFQFTDYDSLAPGDILLRDGHTAIYIGNNQVVEASISENGSVCGEAGDQTGQEILIDDDTGGNWDTYYRLEG